jgi:hypothetical protein
METNMTFTEYIKTQGYELMPRKGKEDDFSTMSVLWSHYKKGDKIITWGLSEYGKPPLLVSPRPFVVVKLSENNYHQDNSHATTERILKELSNEELLTMIETNNLRYEKNINNTCNNFN